MNFERLTSDLLATGCNGDQTDWPVDAVQVLHDHDCFGNVVPRQFGGKKVDPETQLGTYEAIASASVALALIVTQHDAAVELLAAGTNECLKADILSKCAQGSELLTVGISQLTTSRRHVQAALRAYPEENGDRYRLDGVMPWVTSARHANHIVTAAAMEDGQQLIACLPADAEHLDIKDPMDLLALNSSWTSEVRCKSLMISPNSIVKGPMENVLARRAPVKGLTVSSVGMGMANALLRSLKEKSSALAGADHLIARTIEPAYQEIRGRLYEAARASGNQELDTASTELRSSINALITRLSATLMTVSKGTGYLKSQPAQRLLRESAFFLIWSATPSVQTETIRDLWGLPASSPA